jgi:hypothetical protein
MSEAEFYPPSESEWSFKELGEERRLKLEKAPSYDQIVRMVRTALKHGILNGSTRGSNRLERDQRAIIRFPVERDLYDVFFNSRTGYRAQFWRSPKQGVSANAYLVANLLAELCDMPEWPMRENWTLTREIAMPSLVCTGAKVWVNEADYRVNFIQSRRLIVPQWRQDTRNIWERCCAPLPDDCWLDLKGCFVEGREVRSSKDRSERANQIHETGWTWEAKPGVR